MAVYCSTTPFVFTFLTFYSQISIPSIIHILQEPGGWLSKEALWSQLRPGSFSLAWPARSETYDVTGHIVYALSQALPQLQSYVKF